MKNITIKLLLLFVVLSSTSCSITRHLGEEEFLYVSSKVDIKKQNKNTNIKQLTYTYKTLLKQPKPNRKFLGLRLKLRRYNLFYKTNKKREAKGSDHFIGEPPVIYDEKITAQMEKLLKNKAVNEGFFYVQVSSEVKKRKKKARVKYTVELGQPFIIDAISHRVRDSLIQLNIQKNKKETLVKTGQRYDLQTLKTERERIASDLRQKGYYFFQEDFLKFRADTLEHQGNIQLELALKEDIEPRYLTPKTIDQIFVYPDVKSNTIGNAAMDTLDYEGLKIIYQYNNLHPYVFRDALTLEKGQLYSLTRHQTSLERIAFLRNHQFINLQFEPSEISDSLLNVVVELSPRKRHAVEGSLGGSLNSGRYLGPEVSLTYLNRNLFRGAEQLRITTFGNFYFPIVSGFASQQETGVDISVTKPNLWIPFRKRIIKERLIAQTKFGLSYANQKIRLPLSNLDVFLQEKGFTVLYENLLADPNYAPFIALGKIEGNLTYQWRVRPDIQHELTPVHLVFQNPRYEVSELRKFILDANNVDGGVNNSQINLEKMLIINPSYTFLYDSRLKAIRAHNKYYRGKIAFSGNVLLSNGDIQPDKSLESQYFQLENDVRYFRRFSKRQTIGARLAVKVSIPLKNEVILPFFDLYTMGGPNSVRAFRPRSVGPGSVLPVEETFFFTGTGDFSLEGNLEWRPKVNDLLELGFFVDAGNVWLLKEGSSDNELAIFHTKDFYKQLAIGTGFGLRFDFDILILRVDFAFPLSKPWLAEGERWVWSEEDFGKFKWLKNNFNPNIGFGYSF